jgi:HEAT repeat protein
MESKKIDSLIIDLVCDDVITCQKARRQLVAIGHRAVPSLVKALGSKKYWVRWEAAKALAQIGDPTATAALIEALEDKEFDVRWLAAEGLINIGREAVVPLLEALIDNSKSIWMQQGAHHILHDMNRGDLNQVLRPVMSALEDVEPYVEVPVAARKALDKLASEPR